MKPHSWSLPNGSTISFGPTTDDERYHAAVDYPVALLVDDEGRVLDEIAPFTKEDYQRVLRHLESKR